MTGVRGEPGRSRRTCGRAATPAASCSCPYVTGGIDAGLGRPRSTPSPTAGADAIEVGIPFSDPVMDGPTIQAASLQALERGTTPASILSDLRAGAADSTSRSSP